MESIRAFFAWLNPEMEVPPSRQVVVPYFPQLWLRAAQCQRSGGNGWKGTKS